MVNLPSSKLITILWPDRDKLRLNRIPLLVLCSRLLKLFTFSVCDDNSCGGGSRIKINLQVLCSEKGDDKADGLLALIVLIVYDGHKETLLWIVRVQEERIVER